MGYAKKHTILLDKPTAPSHIRGALKTWYP